MSSDTVFLFLKLNLNFPSLFIGNVDCLLKGICFIIHGYVLSIIHRYVRTIPVFSYCCLFERKHSLATFTHLVDMT